MYQNNLRFKSKFYIFLVILLVGASLCSIPFENVSATGEPTTLTIKSPSVDSKINTTSVVISGTYTSEADKTDLLFTAEENDYYSDSSSNRSDWVIDDSNPIKTWAFTSPSLTEGTHTFSVKIKRVSTNEEVTKSITFTIDTLLKIVSTISITSPTVDDVLDSKHVTVSGGFTSDAPTDDLLFTAKDNGVEISDSLTHPGDWIMDNTSKKWSFTTSTLEEGSHNITVEIKNLPISAVSNVSTNFTLALSRPYVSDIGIILANGTKRKCEDLTNVPLNANLRITIADDQPMSHLIENPIKILFGSSILIGTTEINDGYQEGEDGKYYYDITFNPNDNELKSNKTYLVYIDPELVDDKDNPIFTRLFKFTTMTNANWDDPDDPQSHASSNPHGHYQLNTNMCAACHSTHTSKNPSLIGGSYQIEFNEQLTSGQPVNDPSQNYCMACHDGTTNAPSIKNNETQHLHGYTATDTNVLKQQESCTSCHNPHLEWSEKNQNLLKDHYVYTHNEAHPDQGLDTPKVDSLDTSCDSCHDYIDFSTINEDKGKVEPLAYNKSLTAKGETDPNIKTISDYSLCLRCHNAVKSTKDSKPSDIETLYLKQNSGHNFALSANQQTQRDGSVLNGPIPCAECHETHGSNNLFNLRIILGNNPLVSNKFITNGSTWNQDNEKDFCLNCHQNGTEIYGKKATINTTISGHQIADNSPACSQCHSDQSMTYKDFREQSMNTAHAPLAGVDPSNP